MSVLAKSKEVAEHKARGEIERVYHEIRQTLRVSGVNLNFRTWARYEKFFPAMWDAVRPNLETRAFEYAADEVRARAVRAAEKLGRLGVPGHVQLGDSQLYQIQAALDLYHYVNPKLLVLTSALKLALDGEPIGGSGPGGRVELIELGEPLRMYPMEMVSDESDEEVRAIFEDIKQTLSLPSVNSDYRTLALWPDYLEAAWRELKPYVAREDYRRFSDELREQARALARSLPYPIPLSRQRVAELGEDADRIIETIDRFEQLLPSLIINIALFELDWRDAEALSRSPFPAAPRRASGGVS